jgi:hypothetical protein
MLRGRKLAWDRAEQLAVGLGLMTLAGAGALALVIASASVPKQDLWGKIWFLTLFSFLLLVTLVGVVLVGVVLTTQRPSAPAAALALPRTQTVSPLAEPDLAPAAISELEQVRPGLGARTLAQESADVENALAKASPAFHGTGPASFILRPRSQQIFRTTSSSSDSTRPSSTCGRA